MNACHRLPQILFDPDIERIRLLIRNSDKFELLDKLIICFALNHGAIPSELQQIKFSDVDLLDQTITSTTDGQQRFMFLTETDIKYLDDYLASIDDYNLDYFLLSNSDQPIAYHHLREPLKQLSTYFLQ